MSACTVCICLETRLLELERDIEKWRDNLHVLRHFMITTCNCTGRDIDRYFGLLSDSSGNDGDAKNESNKKACVEEQETEATSIVDMDDTSAYVYE